MSDDSFFSDDELKILSESTLHRRTPCIMRGISQTELSVARHYGGCVYNNEAYVYQPVTDELIRDDVLEFVMKLRRKLNAAPSQPSEKGSFDERHSPE